MSIHTWWKELGFSPQGYPAPKGPWDSELPWGKTWKIHATSSSFHTLLNTHRTTFYCLGTTSESSFKQYLDAINSNWHAIWNVKSFLLQNKLDLLPFLPLAYQQLCPSVWNSLLYSFLHFDAYLVPGSPCIGVTGIQLSFCFLFNVATASSCLSWIPNNLNNCVFIINHQEKSPKIWVWYKMKQKVN